MAEDPKKKSSLLEYFAEKKITIDDAQKPFIEALDVLVSKSIEDAHEGIIDERKMLDTIGAELEKVKAGLASQEKFEQLEKALKAQGIAITALKKGNDTKPSVEATKSLKEQLSEALGFAKDGDKVKFAEGYEGFINKKAPFVIEIKAANTMLQATNLEPNGNNFIPVPQIVPGVNSIARNKPIFLENMDVSTTDTPHVAWLNEYNPQGDAAWTAEGNAAPLESMEIQVEDQATQEIIGKFKISEKMIRSVPFILAELQAKGLIRLKLDIDAALASGNGTAPNIKGITTYAPAYTITSLNATVVNPNTYDVIGAMRTQIRTISDQWEPTVFFINPIDAYVMKHAKATTEEYVMQQLQLINTGTLDGMRMVETNQIAVGSILLGDFTKSHVKIWENIKVEFGWENDDFTKRLRTVILYADLLHYVSNNEIGAFVYDTIAHVQTAITK